MEHKIIHTENYLLIVDESEIKEGEYFYSIRDLIEVAVINYPPNEHYGKIIAHLPLNNSPILEGVDLLPPLEDEVEKMANEAFPDESTAGWIDCFSPRERRGFKTGYNKAKEKYKYTEEDLIKLLEWVKTDDYRYFSRTGTSQELLGQVIQSLQQPKMPVGFKCEMYFTFTREKDYSITYEEHDKTPKTITNSLGQIVWVGEYVF